jgi:lipoate-protein ligase A
LRLYLAEQLRLMSAPAIPPYPPLFVMGPPRSGTTLLYQLLVHRFRFAYFSNASVVYGRSPLTLTAKALKKRLVYESGFTSRHGMERGLMAPHEAGPFWNLYFPREYAEGYNYTPKGWLSPSKQKSVKKTVAGMEQLIKAPFVNKNVKHCVRIPALEEIFPDGLYMRVKREPAETALSILKMRKKEARGISQWYAVRPKEYEKLKDLPYLDQIASQVYCLEGNMNKDLRNIDTKRQKVINYDDICKNPRKEMNQVHEWLTANGCHTDVLHETPEGFEKRPIEYDKLSDEERELVKLVKQKFDE